MDEVKAFITFRSGKNVDQPVPKSLDAIKEDKEEEPKRIMIKEDMIKMDKEDMIKKGRLRRGAPVAQFGL